MAELYLNGIFEEEAGKFYHICFFTDREGPDREDPNSYVFVPKVVCRIVDEITVCVQDWYAQKKKLIRYVRSSGSNRRMIYLDQKAKTAAARKLSHPNKPYGAFRNLSGKNPAE